MEKKKQEKLISLKLQSFLGALPYLGFVIVIFMGFYNIFTITKKRIFVALYYLLILIPVILFGGIGGLVYIFFIAQLEMPLVLIWALVWFFAVFLCIAIGCVAIQKGMIERFRKQEEKKVENNLNETHNSI
ncbi:hypothetical protein FACS1894211_02910 [Clostridia bacterium]|nr:hypothetical protein FACS1894211_02910 [Clostridia bacterium]